MGVVIWIISGFFLTLVLRYVFSSALYKKQISAFRISTAAFLPLALSIAWILEWNFLNPVFLMKTRYPCFDSLKNFILDFVFDHGPFYLWTFFYFGIKSWYSFIDHKIKAERAMSMFNYAKLQMLRYQLNPHFLFNSLNSIKALIHENQELAETMVTSLSDFLRATLKYNEELSITVSEELEITEKYLTIEKIRYEERLDYKIRADAGVLDVKIPCLITQPLIENSIKYGLFSNPSGIKLNVSFLKGDKKLIIEVSNSGTLFPNWSKGIGLKNLIERLDNSYPEKAEFALIQENHMVIARIIMPSEA